MTAGGLRGRRLYRFLAEKRIQLPRTVSVTPWISLIYRLSEKDLDVENEVLIRPGKKEDLDFFAIAEDLHEPSNRILLQDIKFWNKYGFRCLYVGYLRDESTPFCLQYWIQDSDNHRFKDMEYGNMYQELSPDTVHVEGGYVRKELRGQDLFPKFRTKTHKILYKKGKKWVRAHIAANTDQTASLKAASKAGLLPKHWISQVSINLPLFKSKTFVHHEIKESDRKKFPLVFFCRR